MGSERVRAVLILLSGLCGASALAEPVPEHALKAAFVFNFAVFAEWPQDALAAGAPLALCASPGTPLFGALTQLNDKPVNGHRIAVRPSTEAPRGCHVLVLEHGDRARWPQLRRELAGAAVLTVSDDAAAPGENAQIALEQRDKRIGFSVDLGAARAARLTLSSKLLRLARSVQ